MTTDVSDCLQPDPGLVAPTVPKHRPMLPTKSDSEPSPTAAGASAARSSADAGISAAHSRDAVATASNTATLQALIIAASG